MFCPQRNCFSLYFHNHITCSCIVLLKDMSCFFASHKTVYLWVMTNCCVMSNCGCSSIIPHAKAKGRKCCWMHSFDTEQKCKHSEWKPCIPPQMLVWTLWTFCSSAITGHSTDNHTPLRVDKDTKSLHNLLCIRSFHNWKTEATVSALTVQKYGMYIFPMYDFDQSILNHQTAYWYKHNHYILGPHSSQMSCGILVDGYWHYGKPHQSNPWRWDCQAVLQQW